MDEIVELFRKIKELGFVESHRRGDTGIGKTFEDLLGVVENNIAAPDFDDYEVKSHREKDNFITLFTLAPTFPRRQGNQYLVDTYGYPEQTYMGKNILHVSMFADRTINCKDRFFFKLIDDSENEVIRIGAYSFNDMILIDQSVFYSYEKLRSSFSKKLKKLFIVNAESRKESGTEFFHYISADIYMNPSFDNFLMLLRNGKIMLDIRQGVYKSGKNEGKRHDHGNAFRIKDRHLIDFYGICQHIV